MSKTKLELLIDSGDRCGEGPIWDFRARRLLWTDIPADVVYEWRDGKRNVVQRGTNVSTIALARDGGLVFGGAGGLWKCTDGGGCKSIVAEHEGETLSINDMIVDPHGRIYAGTVYWGANGREKYGRIYLIDTRGVKLVQEGVELANGMGFSRDGRTFYFADSALRRIYLYRVDERSGKLSERKTFVQLKREDGLPDGLTVDAEDHVWCAFWYGSKVMRFDPRGKVQRVIEVPAIQTSSVAFGGPEMDELYITTAAEPWPSDLAPAGYSAEAKQQGGGLYRLNPGVRGKGEYLAAL
ncbi:MAG TPA: SMP-30/gluconolactonase/LRE family protein [Tepidisphaeraceae bacterium]|jgi:D-xylonolactonase|nr:SMP-30/gluconolactonase/LRE family protein [Tepidisphaeraceae bacterium]